MTSLPPDLTRRLASAERLVPRLRRRAWRREWEAELACALRRGERDGDRRTARRLRRRALWAHVDALWVRKEEMSMTRLFADLKLAARSLRRTPGFTTVAILTLALGIAVNTAVFSVVNGVLLNPLPYDEPDALLSINMAAPGAGYDIVPFSDDVYLEFQQILPAVESLGIYQDETLNLVGDGDPERIAGARITPSVFDVLRVTPHAGRLFGPADAEPGAEPVAALAYEFWQERWGGDESVLDSLVELDGRQRRIVGILPPGFAFPRQETRVWRPYVIDRAQLQPGNFSSPGIARLAPGRSIDDARSDMATAIARLPELFPDEYRPELLEQIGLAPNIVPLMEIVVGDVRQPLLVILGTVALVLLIASANVANLFLVRAESRQREVTLRAALGAGSGDLIRFFLTESLLLAMVSGVLGLLIAIVAVEAFVASAPVAIPRVDQIGTDLKVLGFNFAAAVVAGLLFGSVPLWRHRGRELASELRDGGRTATAGNATLSTRNLLVVAQVALALVLLVGSGLMLRSFQSLRTVDPGFDADGVLAVTLAPAGADYPDPIARSEFWSRVIERLSALPGVERIGAIDHAPLGESRSGGSVSIEDHPVDDSSLPPLAEKKHATPGYFETLGIALRAGRTFEPGDGVREFPAAIVSESFAQHWWPDGSALGKRVREEDDDTWLEIVGVVADVHHLGLDVPAEEVVYFPLEEGSAESPNVPPRLTIMLKTAGNPTALTGALRAALREVDPRLPVTESRPLSRSLADAMARTSFTVTMLGIAAAMALFLGAVGLYGVISYIVSQRTQEIGVRIALGAPAADVRGMVVRRGLALAAVGIVVGLVGAVALSSVLATLLYEVSATDPLTYAGVAFVLALTALVASWVPARRAAAVDPVVALRGE